MRNKNTKGLSLVEILIVITIFSVIGLLTTRSILSTIRGTKKSDSLIRVRENVNLALSVIERQIRNSESVDCANSNEGNLVYTSLEGIPSNFSCDLGNGLIASNGAKLTSSDIKLTSCTFTCTANTHGPSVVKVIVVAEDSISTSAEKGSVSTETTIISRNY